jgi:hypothetical protein
VAVPLRARGVRVTGIELSTPMIDRLRTKAGEAEIPVITGDMATATAPGRYTLVYRDAKLYRTPHRYIWPAELDLMAQLAGFELESRHADWSGTEFTADSRSHVSVYRLG